MQERWLDIPNFSGYRVNSTGVVWSDKSNKVLAQYDGFGYSAVHLRRGGKTYSCRAHRLVASAFLDNYSEDLIVNHKDGNKKNNSVENLECVTPSKNSLHSVWVLGNSSVKRDSPISEEEKIGVVNMRNSGVTVENILIEFNISTAKYQEIVKPAKRKVAWKKKKLPLVDGEIIKLISGYDYYYISNLGNVYSMKYGKRKRAHIINTGYAKVSLYKNGEEKGCFVHRLVAMCFVENKNNVEFVNHINECKTDNRAVNLEWVTRSENLKKAMRKTRKITQYQIDLVRRMNELGLCMTEISDIAGIGKSTVGRIIRGTGRFDENDIGGNNNIPGVVEYKQEERKTVSSNSALTKDEVGEINRLRETSNLSMAKIADMFQVGVGTIHRVIHKTGAYS